MDKIQSRKEKRKAARQEKKQHKHQAMLHHQKFRKLKQNSDRSKIRDSRNSSMKVKEISLSESDSDRDGWLQEDTVMNVRHSGNLKITNVRNNNAERDISLIDSDSDRDALLAEPAVLRKMSRKDGQKVDAKKTKFEEYLEMESKSAMEEDLAMERRLAKKLKVKNGKLRDDDDELNFILDPCEQVYDGIFDSETEKVESADDKRSKKKRKKRSRMEREISSDNDAYNKTEQSILLESGEEDEPNILVEKNSEKEDVEGTEVKKNKENKRKRKKSEQANGSKNDASSNKQANSMPLELGEEDLPNSSMKKDNVVATGVQGSCKYVPPHLRSHSGDDLQEYLHIRRRVRGLLNKLSESNVESITGEISTIFQSVSRAVASQIIGEEVLASCSRGPRGNEQYAATFAGLVTGMACMVGIDFGARLMASLAISFEDEYLKEDNLSLRNLSLLLSYLYIFGVCSSDLIYDFMINLSKRLAEIDVATILTVLQCCGMKLRGDDPASMKDFIKSVQSRVNELKASSRDVEANTHSKRMEFMLETICEIKNNKKRAKEDSPQHTRIKKWLQKLRVEDIAIRGVKWSKLLDPNKKGQWWFSGEVSPAAEVVEIVAGKNGRVVDEEQKMLELAAKQRMNTDTRRAIFCVIMSGEDYIDAFEKLLRLNLQGKQDREIMRVLVECCLQEKVFNKYYTALASKLCSHDKNHRFTLQYCLWDQFKEVESMPLMRSMHLAKFVAEMVAGFTLSLAVLKVVDLIDSAQLTPKRIMHFRMLFEAIFEHPENVVWNVFTRVAVTPELEDLRNGMEVFISEFVVTANKAAAKKMFKLAKKALNNVEGILW